MAMNSVENTVHSLEEVNHSTVRSLEQLNRGYYNALNALCSALLVDPEFKIELHGCGFDEVGAPLITRSAGIKHGKLDSAEVDAIKLLRCYGTQAYHIHRNIIVAEELSKTKDCDKTYVYSNPSGSRTGSVNLTVSSKSYDNISKKSKAGFPLQEGIRACKDSSGMPRFHVSSDVTQRLLGNHVGNVALLHPNTLCNVTPHSNTMYVCSGYRGQPGKLMQGVEHVIALQCTAWPTCASHFTQRIRRSDWPPAPLITSLTDQSIYVIPSPFKTTSVPKISSDSTFSDPAKKARFEWTYSFVRAEKALINSLHQWHIEVLHYLLLLGDAVSQTCGLQYANDLVIINKAALFWCLERGVISTQRPVPELSTKSCRNQIMAGVRSVMMFIHGCLEMKHMPHFFINNYNMLQDVDDSLLGSMHGIVGDLLLDKTALYNILHRRHITEYLLSTTSDLDEARSQRFHRQVVQKATDCISDIFTDMYKLAYLTLYTRLHRYETVDSCIEVHECIQRTLLSCARDHAHPQLIEWCSRLVLNSLANLYLAKAIQTPTPKKRPLLPWNRTRCTEKSYYFQKAEELLLMSNNIDLMTGRIRLANFYLVTNRLEEALDLLHDIISFTASNNDAIGSRSNASCDDASGACETNSLRECLQDNDVSCDKIEEKLLEIIIERNCILDLLFSAHEQCVLPSVIQDCLSMTKTMLMGLQPVAIYVLDPDIIMRFLRVLTLINLAQKKKDEEAGGGWSLFRRKSVRDKSDQSEMMAMGDNMDSSQLQAVEDLEKLEQLCNKEQRDINEKRNVSYYNMAAKCYLLLGLKDKAIPMLEISIQICPNPVRNPARFMLYPLKNDVTRMMVKGGIGVAIGLGVVATVIGVAKSKLG